MQKTSQICSALRDVTGGKIRPGGFALTQESVEYCRLPEGARILDAGCGSGESAAFLSDKLGFKAIGIDTSEELLALGKMNRPALSISLGNAEALDFPDSYFDALLAECVFSRFDDKKTAIKEFRRVLKPSGWLIISDIYCLSGSTGADFDLLKELDSLNFAVTLKKDRTKLLKELSAKLIWKYGALEEFVSLNCRTCRCCAFSQVAEGEKIGYFQLIAQKTGLIKNQIC